MWPFLLAAILACVFAVILRYQLRNAAVVMSFIVGVTAGRVLVVEYVVRALGRRAAGVAASDPLRRGAVTKS